MPPHAPALALSLIVACGAPAPHDAGSPPVAASRAKRPSAAGEPVSAHPSAPASAPPSAPASAGVTARSSADERAALLADLDLLCAALRRDYVDGTLTDYYAGLAPVTTLGQDLRRRGEETMRPGRLLQAAARDLAIPAGDPAIPACNALFDDLDDLE